MKQELRLSGTGGQGLITAGIILAEAALLDGKLAIQSQSYGPEARGGASKAEVIISDEAIHFPKVTDPNLLLAMSQEAATKYSHDLTAGSVMITDSLFVSDVPDLLRFSSGIPNSASSAAICWLIAVWVMKLFCAPRVMLPVCATARKYANRSNFKGVPTPSCGMKRLLSLYYFQMRMRQDAK